MILQTIFVLCWVMLYSLKIFPVMMLKSILFTCTKIFFYLGRVILSGILLVTKYYWMYIIENQKNIECISFRTKSINRKVLLICNADRSGKAGGRNDYEDLEYTLLLFQEDFSFCQIVFIKNGRFSKQRARGTNDFRIIEVLVAYVSMISGFDKDDFWQMESDCGELCVWSSVFDFDTIGLER